MIKCFCDRCGVELTPSKKPYLYKYEITRKPKVTMFTGGDEREIHLCITCTEELDKFLNIEGKTYGVPD